MRLLAALLVAAACTAPTTVPAPTTSADVTLTSATQAATTSPVLTLHWMSLSLHSEPRYRLLYEGGAAGSFTQLRLIGPDSRIVAVADGVPSAGEALRLCGQSAPGRYGAVRATLILATQDLLSDLIRRPDAYRVEVLLAGSWTTVALVNECHGQE